MNKVILVVASIVLAGVAQAQVAPFNKWRTLRTEHFQIHFTPELEAQARRAAASAERAYAQLAKELVEPRGAIHVVMSDDVDYSNGYATVFPSNRIVVYAHPPVEGFSLRNYDDWNALVLTHELTHIFHLDRTRGWWRLGQGIFGRNPFLFPNNYSPAWLTEGLAVYYESRLTGSGRLNGSEHYMIARAAALSHDVPRLNELSLVSSRFPEGAGVYVYGSLLVDYMARTYGPEKIRDLVERSSGQPIPFMVNRAARGTFGISFERAWRAWADSLLRASNQPQNMPESWKELTPEGYYVQFPRWLGDTAIMYTANTGKEVTSLYSVTLDGKRKKLGRRNNMDANVRAFDGSVVYAQQEFINRVNVRSDLYAQRGGREIRLTNGQRLSAPDVRWDGSIVAVQAIPSSTRLVRVSRDGKRITQLTEGSIDVQWSDPRWSPDGTRIVAVRTTRGGTNEIVLLDTTGAIQRVLVEGRDRYSSPSWSRDGNTIVYMSDVTGSSQIHRVNLDRVFTLAKRSPGDAGVAMGRERDLPDDPVGVFQPELSLDNTKLAAVTLREDGYHLGVLYIDSIKPGTRARGAATTLLHSIPSPGTVSIPSTRYNPFSTLLPRYWAPTFTSDGSGGVAFGALTSGSDVIGRHSYALHASYNGSREELYGYASYRYARLRQPLLDFSVEQSWSYPAIASGGIIVGRLKRRDITYSMLATLIRPRYRTFSSLSAGVELETRDHNHSNSGLLALLAPGTDLRIQYPAAVAIGSWSNTKSPTLAISPEDGVAIRGSMRHRWRQGTSGTGFTSLVGSTALYKSLNLPGYAHHVIALRLAGAHAGQAATTGFSVGGISGGSLELFPGYSIGDQQRNFPVRGFPSSTQSGTRAVGASVEYRAPLTLPARGIGLLPVFLNKTSITLFSDAARAYCPANSISTPFCLPGDVGNPWIASAGAELNLDSALQFDVPYRFRVGVAGPIANGSQFGVSGIKVYFTLGSSF